MSLEQMRRLIQEELAKQLDGEEAIFFILVIHLSQIFASCGFIKDNLDRSIC